MGIRLPKVVKMDRFLTRRAENRIGFPPRVVSLRQMKKPVPFFALALALFTATPSLMGETAKEIIEKFEAQKAEALETYLGSQPEAPDREMAVEALVGAYQVTGNSDRVIELLTARLKKLPTGTDMEPREYVGVLQGLVETLTIAGKKDDALALIQQAKKDAVGHPMVGQLTEFLEQIESGFSQPSVGDTLEIAFTGLNGEAVDLAAMKGKVVLIDFWATWCGPCVAELPNVSKTYAEYHDKGFEVIGISLDEDKAALESFIKEKEMPWPQDFTGKGWETELAAKFGIQGIPATFLIGKDGKVVAKDLRGTALAESVEKALAAE